jgi:hypothetical protein
LRDAHVTAVCGDLRSCAQEVATTAPIEDDAAHDMLAWARVRAVGRLVHRGWDQKAIADELSLSQPLVSRYKTLLELVDTGQVEAPRPYRDGTVDSQVGAAIARVTSAMASGRTQLDVQLATSARPFDVVALSRGMGAASGRPLMLTPPLAKRSGA